MRRLMILLSAAGLLAGACGGDEAPSDDETSATTSAAPTGGDTTSAPPEDACAKDSLAVKNQGQLTVGTDNPAYSPWFAGGEVEGEPWKINSPTTGKGFESAVAYAVAEELGFSKDEVRWVETPFVKSFAPGEKDFDFYLAQVSFKPGRTEGADLSEGYYDVNQALVAPGGTEIAAATTLEELKKFKLAAPVATTSLDYIEENIQPEQDPAIYDDLNAAVTAVNNGQADGVVVDFPTAVYLADPYVQEVENGVVVGQFPAVGEQEHFSLVLDKDSPLTDCVNEAIGALQESGELGKIEQKWLSEKTNVGEVPFFEA